MKLYAVIFVSGLIIGALAYALIAERKAPGTERTTNTKTITTEIKKTEGVPDTTINEKRETKKIKAKSVGTTKYSVPKNEAGISKITIGKSDNDSSEVELEFKYPETTIKKVDEIERSTVEKDSTTWVPGLEKESNWQIAIGTIQYWKNQIDVYKYAELSYQKKIWFFSVKGAVGINNKLNDALNNLEMHTKLELNIPLN